MKHFRNTLLTTIVISLICSQSAFAASPSFAVYPGTTDSNTRLKYMTEVGSTIKDSLKLENKSDTEITLQLKALDAHDDDGNKMIPIDQSLFDVKTNAELPKVKIINDNMHLTLDRNHAFLVDSPNAERDYVGQWVMLEKDTITLKPGESKNINFEINIPDESEEYMTYTGGILVSSINSTASDSAYVTKISTSVAERIYIDVLPHSIIKKYLPAEPNNYSRYILAGIIMLLLLVFILKRKRK